ncbi:MAG: hypothetical protein H0T89_33705 [Deltaproteobacteria bacterium]|nr:hypothetical protein [Deltaproteobacteria bacterium]MDQ3301073.1 hypothetical protein [Myxococcota bacterium]
MSTDGKVDDSAPVPRIPRSRGFKLSMPELVRLLMTAALLVMIVMTQRPCAEAVSGFVTGFDGSGETTGSGGSADAARQMPRPGTVDLPSSAGSAADYERLTPDMTEAEIKAAIERAKAKQAGSGH